MSERRDMYEQVTNSIIEQLEAGVIPWRQPWNSVLGCAWSGSTGRPYSFLNQMLLMPKKDGEQEAACSIFEQVRGEYLTFKQVQERGGHVKKGAKQRTVVFWKMLNATETVDEVVDGETVTKIVNKTIPCLKGYGVFKVGEDTEGVEQKYHRDELYDFNPVEEAEAIITAYVEREGIALHVEKGSRAFYRPADDSVTLPEREQFADSAEFYSTAFHELVHSTGAEKRLNRGLKNGFGSEEYSKEELVAEIGSAFLCNTLGIETTLKNSAAYIGNWLKALKNDKRMIVTAAGAAEKAANLILKDWDPIGKLPKWKHVWSNEENRYINYMVD